MNAAHRAMLAVSFGRLGWTAGKMPVLELTTTGRKSGRKHAVMLTSPIQEGSTLVVVASRGGDDQAPAWYLNLVANADVDVALQGDTPVPMRARVAYSRRTRQAVAASHGPIPELRGVPDPDRSADSARHVGTVRP